MLHTSFQYVDLTGVRGDYLEFGVWKGNSLIAAYHLSRRFGGLSQMRFCAFDSFEGMPHLSQNQSEAQEFPPGMFQASLEEVKRNLANAKVDMNRVTLINGWYAKTLNHGTRNTLALGPVAIANIDCDVFESTVPVLDFIEPHLVDGSIVIFDDWYCFKNNRDRGQQKAFREWLARNRHLKATPYKEFGWDGRSFIINRSSKQNSRVLSAETVNDGSPAGPLQEHEHLFELVNDSIMTRTMEGRIDFWNRSAEKLYGWRKEEVIGRVSHNLLQTQFPKPLEEIESELVQSRRWEGKLVHTTRDGHRVVVESRWTLELEEQSGAVVEINRLLPRPETRDR